MAHLARATKSNATRQDQLDRAALLVANGLGVEFSCVVLREPTDGRFVMLASHGCGAGVIGAPESGLDTMGSFALDAGEPVLIPSLALERRFPLAPLFSAYGMRCGIIAPFGGGADLAGWLGGFSAAPRSFAADDRSFLEVAAHLMNIALASAGLRERLEAATAADLRARQLGAEFWSNTSHEIRSRLNVILGYNELLGDYLGDHGELGPQAWAAAVQRAGTRLLGTVDDILEYFRLDCGINQLRPEPIALGRLLQSLAGQAAAAAAAKGLSFSCTLAASEALVRADHKSLRLALTKVIDNAIKFTAQGAVTIRLDRAGRGVLRLAIADTGIGIAPEYLPHIFEPFSQESANFARRFEGTGLGMAIANQYLELNDASLTIASEKGRGSTFTIFLREAMADLQIPVRSGRQTPA